MGVGVVRVALKQTGGGGGIYNGRRAMAGKPLVGCLGALSSTSGRPISVVVGSWLVGGAKREPIGTLDAYH